MSIDINHARTRLRAIVSHGLVARSESRELGNMCIENALRLALREPYGAEPSLVHEADLAFVARINAASWSSNKARSEALLRIGLATLGTAGTDRSEWIRRLVGNLVRRALPVTLRAAACNAPSKAVRLRIAAKRCEVEGTKLSAVDGVAAISEASTCSATVAAYAYAVSVVASAVVDSSGIDFPGVPFADSGVNVRFYAAQSDRVLRLAVAAALEAYHEERRT